MIQLALGAILGLLGVLGVVGTLKIRQRAAQRRQSVNLLARCEYEHAAWRRGDDALAVYGQYPPRYVKVDGQRIRIWSDALPRPARVDSNHVHTQGRGVGPN